MCMSLFVYKIHMQLKVRENSKVDYRDLIRISPDFRDNLGLLGIAMVARDSLVSKG